MTTSIHAFLIGWLSCLLILAGAQSQGATLNVDITKAPYNAIPNDGLDDAPAFQRALNDINAVDSRTGAIFIPAGSYNLNSQVVSTSNGADKQVVSLIGASTASTVIHCNNTSGGIRIESIDRPTLTVFAQDFSLIADRPGAGTALAIVAPEMGIRQSRATVIKNVAIGRLAGGDYFDSGLVVGGQHRSIFQNVSFEGPADVGGVADSALIFKPVVGIRINGYGLTVENCRVAGAYTAFEYKTENAEGGTFLGCSADLCRIGLDIYTEGQEPGLHIGGCSMRARDIGIRIQRRRLFDIADCQFSTLTSDTAYPYKDIYLTDCRVVGFKNNVFLAGNPNRTCFAIDGVITGDLGHGKPESIIIDQNDFCTSRAQALSIGSAVTGVRILANRFR